jgi:hypothetical protein
MVNLIIALLCYWPFMRRYDRGLLARETDAGDEAIADANG